MDSDCCSLCGPAVQVCIRCKNVDSHDTVSSEITYLLNHVNFPKNQFITIYFRNHFRRTTVSLGDHNVKVFNDAHSVFRKISRIVRFPSYDQNLIDGDIALLHLSAPVPLSSNNI